MDIKTLEQFIFGKKTKALEKKTEEILAGLGFTQEKDTVTPPLRRSPDDMNITQDIYEEIARIYGYDQIESLPLLSPIEYRPYHQHIAIQRRIEEILVMSF